MCVSYTKKSKTQVYNNIRSIENIFDFIKDAFGMFRNTEWSKPIDHMIEFVDGNFVVSFH